MLIAHRGYPNNKYGENTIEAFINAFNNNFDGIETDLRLTKDNIIVCLHDPFISRVSNGFGLAKNKTLSELKKYNFHKKICTLDELQKRFSNKIIFLELKEKIKINNYINNKNYYYICSFNYDYIKDLPQGKYKLGIINYIFNTNIDLKKIDFIMILGQLLTNKIYEYYHSFNIEIVVYGTKNLNINIKDEYKNKLKFIF